MLYLMNLCLRLINVMIVISLRNLFLEKIQLSVTHNLLSNHNNNQYYLIQIHISYISYILYGFVLQNYNTLYRTTPTSFVCPSHIKIRVPDFIYSG